MKCGVQTTMLDSLMDSVHCGPKRTNRVSHLKQFEFCSNPCNHQCIQGWHNDRTEQWNKSAFLGWSFTHLSFGEIKYSKFFKDMTCRNCFFVLHRIRCGVNAVNYSFSALPWNTNMCSVLICINIMWYFVQHCSMQSGFVLRVNIWQTVSLFLCVRNSIWHLSGIH